MNKFDDLVDEGRNKTKTYGIRFIRRDGFAREIFNARKNVKMPNAEKAERGKFRYNMKFHGTILLFDDDAEEFRSVKVAQIFQFRDYNSEKWFDVFH